MSFSRERLRALVRFDEPAIELSDQGSQAHDGYALERLAFNLGGIPVRGLLTRPLHAAAPCPAILYAHSHGGRYDIGAAELMDGREYLQSPYGPELARAGYVTLAIDMPVFGTRATVSEAYAAKALLWHGESLLGQMLSDLSAALTWLAARPDVDATRIAALGMSMGCTLSYFLAAMDQRIAAVAQLCCFADQRTMIELGAHDGHGIYMVVPGLLSEADAGSIAALVAPRPQLVTIGEADKLTPPLAVERALAELRPAYASQPQALEVVSEPGIGHQETPAMRAAVMRFLSRHLAG